MFKNKIAVITGGASGIGKAINDLFIENGANTCIIDIKNNDFFVGDISDEKILKDFVQKVISKYGKIDYLINNAIPITKGIDKCSFDEFNYALKVGITAPFYLSKLFLPYFNENASIINTSSSRDSMSQPNTESYTAAKGGINALTHALAISLSGRIRVNSISPGWIDTTNSTFSIIDNIQHPAGRVGIPNDIANMVLFLCSDKASFITGENIKIDGGMSKLMIYHDDNGWKKEI